MRPMSEVIGGVAAVGDRIDAVYVIDITIAVIVAAVRGNLTRVTPEIRGDVRMIEAYSGIDHRHDHTRGIGTNIPRCGCLDIGAGDPVIAVIVRQRPLP